MWQVIRDFLRNFARRKRAEAIREAFNDGKTLSSFIAPDVHREVQIVSIDEIDSGFIVARIRTNNVLYVHRNLMDEHPFGEPQKVAIDSLWEWTGQSWGGLPDGTSILDQTPSDPSNEKDNESFD